MEKEKALAGRGCPGEEQHFPGTAAATERSSTASLSPQGVARQFGGRLHRLPLPDQVWCKCWD